ncbi:uncharacterized protein LOC121517127 [Cheilinus undulatus]|uniref:uncharacterized protein LOC121517127 n=1 Tax=Cheilinus undulatus TaxID=241271 RepID=UPI001BD3492A|nr:uncharacterized protein LOC121517127 [Cheilinus undulatus]
MSEEQEEAVPWGKPGRPDYPTPSGMSVKSDQSKDDILNFGAKSGRPDSPSGLSMRSDRSKDDILNFREKNPEPGRPDYPTPSGMSVKSDQSKDDILNFGAEPGRPDSPSGLSMRSDQSKDDILNFRDKKSEPGRPDYPTPSGMSVKSDQSKDDILNFGAKPGRPDSPSGLSMRSDRSKDDILNFRDKNIEGRPDYPTPSGVSFRSDQSKDDILNFSGRQPGSRGRKSDSNPPIDTGGGPGEPVDEQKKLIAALKKRYKETLTDGDKSHPNRRSTEHITGDDKNPEKSTQVEAISDIFKEMKEQKMRTVLTVGETGIGKSYHVQKFIKEWAAERNEEI